MKTRSTKKALLASLLSLVVCISMLVGTTFAWFTDSVTSANNIIKSGNLDIELEYWNGTDWVDVAGKSDILTNTLWEPGVTEVAYLRVANAGSLALKYQLGVNIVSEKAGKNVAGKEFKLSDYIQFGVVENVNGKSGAYANREAAVAAVTGAKKISAGYTKADSMATGEELYLALVVWMPTTVGNEANHDGVNAPVINLGINLFATQMTAESDSFNNQYDKDAWHPNFVVTNSDELKVALTNGGNVALANDVIISESLPVTKDTVIDLNGKNIGTSGSTNGSPLYLKGGKLTVKNGTLDLDGSHTNVNGTFSTAIGYDAKTELVVENVNFTGTTAINGTFATDGPLKIAISDCTMDVTSVGIAVSANSTEAIATINNCNIDAGEYAIFASQGSKITINGGTYKSAGKVITSMYDNTVVTINGGTFDGELWVTSGGSLVIKGGTFTADPSAYVAPGHQVTNNGDGTWTVERKYINVVSAGENKDVNGAALADAITKTTEASFIKLPAGAYNMPSIGGSKEVTIVGTKDTVIDLTAGAYMDGSKVAFEGVTIKGSRGKVNGNGSDDAALYTPNVTYTDCTFYGPFAVGRDGAKFIRCTFNNLGNDYVWNMSNDTVFEGCTFNTDGKALLLYAHGPSPDGVATVVVKNCKFNATKGAKAGAIANQNCAAIEIQNYGCSIELISEGNTHDSNFSGMWRIKTYDNRGYTVTVNGTEYTSIAVDGKTMTIDADKNVTVNG